MEQEQQTKPKKKRIPTGRNPFKSKDNTQGRKLKWTDESIFKILKAYKEWMFQAENHIFFEEFLLTVFQEEAPNYVYFLEIVRTQPQFKDEWKYIKALQEMRLKKGLIYRNGPYQSKGCQFLLQTNFEGYIPRTEVVEINDNIQLEFNDSVITKEDLEDNDNE